MSEHRYPKLTSENRCCTTKKYYEGLQGDFSDRYLGVKNSKKNTSEFLTLSPCLNLWYSRFPVTRTLANSNLALTRTKHRFPLDFRHTFPVILPSVTRTNFRFPSGHFVSNFTLDNSNHVLSP